MPLCPNTYRRGTIYWWRRRFANPATGRRRTLALSLGVRDPRSARIIGAKLNAAAEDAARRLELRMISFEDVGGKLITFAVDPAVLAKCGVEQVPENRASDREPTYTAAQERAMLLAMARESDERLTREAIYNRTHGGLDRPDEIDANAVLGEAAIGFIYKLVATRGSRTRVDEADEAAMAARGLTPELIEFVGREAAYWAKQEWPTSWGLGPDRAYFERFLHEADVAATDGNVIAIRGAYLALFAELLFDAERRYRAARTTIDEVLGVLRGGSISSLTVPLVAETTSMPSSPAWQQAEPRTRVEADVASAPAHSSIIVQASAPIEPGSERSFTGRIELLAKRKVKAKKDGRKDGWDEKTANQQRSVARLFAKRAGTDDPTRMSQEDVSAYRNLLDVIPKAWGKSSKDEFRSLEEVLARSEDLDEAEIGLQWATINRHLELGTEPSDVAQADDGAGEGCEGEVDVGAPLIADGEAAELGKPSEGALDDPAMAPELLAGFDTASGDPRRDGAGAALDPAAAMVISPGSSPGQALVGMELVRPTTRATPTARAHARHRVERGSQHHAVVAVGPAQRQAERRAPRVQMIDWSTRWRLVPGLPRSVGFGPVASPPFGWQAGAVERRPAPVQGTGIVQLLQQRAMEVRPGPGLVPIPQAAPTGLAATAQRRRHVLPRHARAQHQEDARQCRTVRAGWASTFRLLASRRQQRCDGGPKIVGTTRRHAVPMRSNQFCPALKARTRHRPRDRLGAFSSCRRST